MANLLARSLRKRLTRHEARLWRRLKTLKASGFHFRRQVPLEPYIVDFAELSHRLVIEIDGAHHAGDAQALADRQRDRDLSARGFHVLRFWNSDVVTDIEAVLEAIFHAARRPP